MRERRRLRPLRKRFAATSIPIIFLLGGVLIWTPVCADGQSFLINHIDNTNVLANTSLVIQVSVTDSNIPPAQLNFTLASNRPNTDATNANITLNYGLFTWTPAQTQAVTFTVSALSLSSGYQTSTNFIVVVTNNVTPPATPPSLALSPPFSSTNITVGTTLAFTAIAATTDGSTNALTFSLVTAGGAAQTATIDPNTGVFTWTPGAVAAGGGYDMTVIVTETNTSPLLTNSQLFTINVAPLTNNCDQYADFLKAMEQGGHVVLTNCSTLVLSNTITITNIVFLDAISNNVTIAGNNLLRLFTVQSNASLALNGLTLLGGSSDSGGAIYNLAGGTVVVSNCVFAGNSAAGTAGGNGTDGASDPNYGRDGGDATGGQPGVGGAILNLGSLTAISCVFSNNSATGGSGGSGGNGSSANYRGGNGGHGGDGALGFGGAIYSAGTSLWLSGCIFSGNTATGGAGGTGGFSGNSGLGLATNIFGTSGAFPGYMGTGGAGGEGSGAAVYSANGMTNLGCTFSGNTAQGGTSAAGGQAGGGYGVNGAHGGNSYGGGVCLLGGGQLVNCGFTNNTVIGGNGGDGGVGNYIAGNGGNGGGAVGGCLYNYGRATVVNCGFSGCAVIGGTNGVAGSGSPFAGTDGQPAASGTNASALIASNTVFAAGLPGAAYPAVVAPGNNLSP